MALRDINLIPVETLHRRYVARHISVWAGGLVFLLGVIFGFYQYQVRTVLPRQRPVTTLEDMHLKLGTTMEEIKVTQTEIERLSHQEAFIKKLSTTQPFSRLLNRLSTIMNAQTWLTELTVDTDTESEQKVLVMKLSGFSLSNDELGNFLTRLSEDRLFENVVLKYAKENRIAGLSEKRKSPLKVIRFQIDLNISGPEG
jgi:Tfp pilus assembly protein PilN